MDIKKSWLYRRRKRGGPSAFDPLSLSPVIWIKNRDLLTTFQNAALTTPATSDADPLGGVSDASGNSRHVTQSVAGKRATLKLAIQNSRAIARFDGVDDFLQSPTFALSQPYTYFAVFYNRSTQDGSHVLIGGYTANKSFMYFSATNTLRIYGGAVGPSVTALNNTWNIVRATFDGAGSKLSINGGSDATGNAGALAVDGFTLGAEGNGAGAAAFFTDIDIGEFIAFSGAMGASDVALMNTYLNGIWGGY